MGVLIQNLKFEVQTTGGAQAIIDMERLEIAPGRLTALSGPSGSGKSTLLHLLSGLLLPTAGSVVWNGTDLVRLGERARDRWRRRHAGFVFQNFHLIDELGPVDNVLVTAWFTRLWAGSWRQRARGLLEELEVPLARRAVSLLSRGEQQRVAIARALLLDPPVLFADEPTASLDAVTGVQVAGILKGLASEAGKTVIVASHDPAVLGLADRVIRIDRGHLVGKAA